jgi:hypothetical protein
MREPSATPVRPPARRGQRPVPPGRLRRARHRRRVRGRRRGGPGRHRARPGRPDQRGPPGPLGHPQRQAHQPRPGQERLHQAGGRAVGELAGPRAEQREPAVAQDRHRGGDGVRREHDVRVDEHQHPPGRRGGELRARVRFAQDARGRRRASQDPQAGIGPGDVLDQRGRAVRGAVVEDEQLQVRHARLGEQRADGRRDPVRLVAGGDEHGDAFPHGRGLGRRDPEAAEVEQFVEGSGHGEAGPGPHRAAHDPGRPRLDHRRRY